MNTPIKAAINIVIVCVLAGLTAQGKLASTNAAVNTGNCIVSKNAADSPIHSTIQQGLDDVACLTLDIRAGTYEENVVISRSVALIGAGQNATIIDGRQLGRVVEIKSGATVLLKSLAVQNGRIADIGGGIYTEYGTDVEIEDAAILSNTAALGGARNLGFGGGIYNSSDMTIANSVIAYNIAEGWGGGIDHYGPSLLVLNTTIAENRSGSLGGGILSNGTSGADYDLRIENSTIARNHGTAGLSYYSVGGIPDAVRLINSIVAENAGSQCTGNIINSGGNVVSDNTCSNIAQQAAGLNSAGLQPVGSTWAIPLASASAAIDAISLLGTCAHRDQRGVQRPQDGNNDSLARCDAGALEMTAQDFGNNATPTPGLTRHQDRLQFRHPHRPCSIAQLASIAARHSRTSAK